MYHQLQVSFEELSNDKCVIKLSIYVCVYICTLILILIHSSNYLCVNDDIDNYYYYDDNIYIWN